MVNDAILGALKSALERGESLKKAMMTLYNAGYKKEEISEAARSINENGLIQPQQARPVQQPMQGQPPATPQLPTTVQKLASKFKQQPQQVSQYLPPQQTAPAIHQPQPPQMQQQAPGMLQKVSGYGQPPKPQGKTIIIILGFLLLILIGILATIFLFKEELLDFFNNLFS